MENRLRQAHHWTRSPPAPPGAAGGDGPLRLALATEAVAIALHKTNVHLELSGWAPRYVPDEVVREAEGRLADQVLFGSDARSSTPAGPGGWEERLSAAAFIRVARDNAAQPCPGWRLGRRDGAAGVAVPGEPLALEWVADGWHPPLRAALPRHQGVYRCPGCHQEIFPPDPPRRGLAGGEPQRRHWHKACWERRFMIAAGGAAGGQAT